MKWLWYLKQCLGCLPPSLAEANLGQMKRITTNARGPGLALGVARWREAERAGHLIDQQRP